MIRDSLDNGVLTVTIDRPEKKNALTLAMRREIEALPARVTADPSINVVVLAAVPPVFCAGADLGEISSTPDMPSSDPGAALRSIGVPTIAAVNGTCVTGGLELALSCDFIVASTGSRFADTHAKLGVIPRWGMSALLPRRVGLARAKELSLSGRWVDAEEAALIGLANRVVDEDEFDDTIAELVQSIASNPAEAVRTTLNLLDAGAELDIDGAFALEKQTSEAFVVDTSRLRPPGGA